MSLEKIIEQINAQAQQRAGQIIDEAKQKAGAIAKKAKEDALQSKEAILENARQKAEEREKRMIQMALLSGKKALLAEKQKAINSLFSSALNHLAGLNPGRYKSIIRHMLMKSVRTGKEEIILSQRDKKILDADWLRGINKDLAKEKGLSGELRFSKETRDIKGGLILRDGKVEINSSFEAVLKYKQHELESEVARLLLGKQ